MSLLIPRAVNTLSFTATLKKEEMFFFFFFFFFSLVASKITPTQTKSLFGGGTQEPSLGEQGRTQAEWALNVKQGMLQNIVNGGIGQRLASHCQAGLGPNEFRSHQADQSMAGYIT